MKIETVAVIGAGTMGNGIAHVMSQKGLHVILIDIKDEFVQRGLATIRKNMERELKKEKITTELLEASMARIRPSTEMNDIAVADFLVEAATENEALKLDLFRKFDSIANPEIILASNTSSISITKIAAVTRRPDQVIGMHFMNPVPMMKLVEVIRGLQTSDQTMQTIRDLSAILDKTAVEVNDYPGFISNRILMPMINEAVYTLMEGVATKEAIDEIMKLGMAHPMGPLTLADLIGLDTCLNIMNVLYEGLGDSKYRPCPLLKKMVDAGYLGRKSSRGFYEYH